MITEQSTFTARVTPDLLPFDLEKTVLFDIETTGFAARSSKIYMIGIVRPVCGQTFSATQFFNDDGDEQALLISFFHAASSFENILHFNGNGFDIPFLLAKCAYYNLDFDFSGFQSFDLYKEALSLKSLLKAENLKQKTLERFFGLFREDLYSGGELINVYHDYENSKEEKLAKLLLLHNLEDMKGMVTLFGLYQFTSAFLGNFSFLSYEFHDYNGLDGVLKKEILFRFLLNYPVPSPISGGNEHFYFTMSENNLQIRVLLRQGELKFFYPDYKNYYYLPAEDMAIHKSVAFYVDKDFRTQAKAANCYGKKTGMFLPEYDEIICPYFKAEYHDKIYYFEADKTFLENRENVKKYALHILSLIRAGKYK